VDAGFAVETRHERADVSAFGRSSRGARRGICRDIRPRGATVQAIPLDDITGWLAGHAVVDGVVPVERVVVVVGTIFGLCAGLTVRMAPFVGGVRLRADVPEDKPTASGRARAPADAAVGEGVTTAHLIPQRRDR
jgi:hypothetical protein